MDWSSGTMSGSGTTTIVSGATLAIHGTGYKSLSGRTIENDGAATWSDSGNISGSGGVIFNNNGSFEARNSESFYGSDTTFNNEGAFTKSTSSGATDMNVIFNNSGTVDIQIGTLNLDSGGSSTGGSFQGDSGSTLCFHGSTYDLDANSSVTHPHVLFEWGNVNINGTYNVDHTTLNIGSTVNFNSSVPVTSTIVTHSGGALTGSGDLVVTSGYNWTSGTMSGSGVTTIASGATLSISGSGYKSLSGRTIENNGGATWSGSGDINGSGGAVFNNNGTFAAQNSESFSGSNATFNNDGAFTKSTSSGTTAMSVVFNNHGTVDVQIGTLSLNSGGSSTGGSFQGDPSSTLCFHGSTYDLDANSSVTHPNVLFEWGTVNVNGDYDVGHTTLNSGSTANFNTSTPITSATVTHSGGTLAGSGNLIVTSGYNWTSGTMSGSGVTTIASGATLSISGSGYKSLSGRTIENNGGATWSGSGDINGSGGAVFNNNGTFAAQNSESFSGSNATFNNDGAFTKSTSSGTTAMSVVFNNHGTVDVQIGTLSLNSGGSSTGGSFQGDPSSTLCFHGSTYDLDANSSVTHPNVLFEWGTVNVNGDYDVGHTTLNSGSTANFNTSTPITSATVTHSGGTLAGSGNLIVTSGYNWTSGTMSGSGVTTIASGATLSISGSGYKSFSGRTIENNGEATWSGSGDINGSGGAVFNNNGAFAAQNSESFSGSEATFNNNGAFTKSISSGITTMSTVFNNHGTVEVQLGVLKFSGGDYVQTTGVTCLNGGDIEIAYYMLDIQGGILTGEGAILGDVYNRGAVVPGNTPGIVSIDEDYTQGAAGSLNIEIEGTTPGTDFDQLVVGSDSTLAGTLNVTLNGFTPSAGDTFQIVTYASHTGAFDTLDLPVLPDDLVLRITYTDDAAILSVTRYFIYLPLVLRHSL